MCQPWYYPFNSSQKWLEANIKVRRLLLFTKKISSSSTLSTLIMPNMVPGWPCNKVVVYDYNVVLSNQADGHAIHNYNSSKIVFFVEPL